MADGMVWKHDIDYLYRGCVENSYVITNGLITEVATGYYVNVPELMYAGALPVSFTPGTTLLAMYNNDAMAVPNGIYGTTPLKRRIIIDEVGIECIPAADANFFDMRLVANLLWMNQATIDIDDWFGSCENYWAAIWEGAGSGGGGGADLGLLTVVLTIELTELWRANPLALVGKIIDATSTAQMTVTQWVNATTFIGIMTDATDYIPAEACVIDPFSLEFKTTVASFDRYGDVGSGDDMLRYGPDRYYNNQYHASNYPLGRGPNALVAYADFDGETVADPCIKQLVPAISSNQHGQLLWRPPKDSVIIDPGQAIALQLYMINIPPVGYMTDGVGGYTIIEPTGNFEISAWIRFRQPCDSQPPFVLQGRTDVY